MDVTGLKPAYKQKTRTRRWLRTAVARTLTGLVLVTAARFTLSGFGVVSQRL